jgi:phosphatidylserine decarboxylase
MTVHKEGFKTLTVVGIFFLGLNSPIIIFSDCIILKAGVGIVSLLLFLFILRFFRKPDRKAFPNENQVISPCDGTVVVIEKTKESEFFHDERLQVSIFMSAWNVHINWFPVSGIVKYFKYHPGLYLLARNPKSSLENERTTLVVEHSSGKQVLFRQIAGFVARRVVARITEGQKAIQCTEFGFIKFGSRVDILLPADSKVLVQIGQKVRGTQTPIAEL